MRKLRSFIAFSALQWPRARLLIETGRGRMVEGSKRDVSYARKWGANS
jgi:hypothetical protein